MNVRPTTSFNDFKEIGKWKKLDTLVPSKLCENQNNRRFEMSSTLFLRNNYNLFLDRIAACDEKRILKKFLRRSPQ